jgi:hypothetical protein
MSHWQSSVVSDGPGCFDVSLRDKPFDPALRALYYVCAIEIPTSRWITYDAKAFGVDIPEGAPADAQEGTYTSPIGYTPEAG